VGWKGLWILHEEKWEEKKRAEEWVKEGAKKTASSYKPNLLFFCYVRAACSKEEVARNVKV
jgi:hypothetical protein